MYDRSTGPQFAWCPTGYCSLPDLYPWTLPTFPGQNPWNFSTWVPQAVHINLGTNDARGSHFSNATFVAGYEATYAQFIRNISAWYGDSSTQSIRYFVGFGPMSSDYNSSLVNVQSTLGAEGFNITILDYNVSPYSPVGCEWHPSVPVHQAMAAKVQPTIAKVMGWQ